MTGTDPRPGTDGDREAAVFERIEAFRRRAPRLLDDVVTLAHGAGGKASAALLDACSCPPSPTTRSAPRPTPPSWRCRAASGWRSAPTRTSCTRCASRGGSVGHLAVHGTVNDLAMMGARPQALSAAFVLEEGFPIEALREIVADMAEAAAAAGVEIVTGDTKVVDRGAADGLYISTSGVGLVPAGRDLRPARVRRGRRRARVGHDRRPRHGRDAGPGRPGPRRRHRVRHRAAQRAGRGAAGRRAGDAVAARRHPGRRRARCATSWPAPPSWPSCSTRRRCPCGPRWRPPASCSGSTRSTSPTRASSWRSCRRRETDAALDALRAQPLGPRRRAHRRVRPEPARHRRAADPDRQHPDRRHAGRRPPAPHLLRPST